MAAANQVQFIGWPKLQHSRGSGLIKVDWQATLINTETLIAASPTNLCQFRNAHQWQFDNKSGAFVHFGFKVNIALEPFDDAFADGQTQPRS
jgi:hypothetical protein